MYVLYLVGDYNGGLNDSRIHDALEQFFTTCGCPKYGESQHPDIGRDLTTAGNFAARLGQHRVRVISGPVIKRRKSRAVQANTLDAAVAAAKAIRRLERPSTGPG